MNFFSRLTPFVKKYEHHIASVMVLLGFVVDSLTLNRVDLFFENVVMVFYLLLAGCGISLLVLQERKLGQFIVTEKVRPYIYLAMQYAFGGLFSAFFVFYTKSGTIISSWPFLLVLLGLFVGNELLKNRYSRLVFQISVLYLTLLSYLIFIIPVITGKISTLMFLTSTGISLVVIVLFVLCLYVISSRRIKETRNAIIVSILSIFTVMQGLYFSNAIPPLPLGLKDIGVYHNVMRTPTGYILTEEVTPWYEELVTPTSYHLSTGEPVYVWSSVFAPTKISTRIFHEWQYFDRASNSWVTSSRIPFTISGGRDGGYRGYSFKQYVFPGSWRVNVLTENNKVIGRYKFIIEAVTSPVEQQTIEK